MTEPAEDQGTWTITIKGDREFASRLRAAMGGDVIEGEMAVLSGALRHAAWTPPSDQRIERALDFARQYASIDGDHHKLWVIDQMARALTGCPLVPETGTDYKGNEYTYERQGENDAYSRVASEWDWEEGIAP